jgi:Fe-S cluster assembly ATP-binding protein
MNEKIAQTTKQYTIFNGLLTNYFMSQPVLKISNLHAQIESLQILKGLNLEIKKGEIHAIMGPNGSGKSTLSKVIMGHPGYEVTKGEIDFQGENITELEPDERAKKGIFMAFQHPKEIAGIKFSTFIRTAQKAMLSEKNEKAPSVIQFNKDLKNRMKELHIPTDFTDRYINIGFSGGEKKKGEILQMQTLEPTLSVLDEIDSGLDVDALRLVAKAVQEFKNQDKSILIITHYQRILEHVQPDFVHVMVHGKIVKSGGKEFAKELEEEGYAEYLKNIEPTIKSLNVLE